MRAQETTGRLSSAPDLSDSRADSPGLWRAARHPSALLGWSVRLARAASCGQAGAEFPRGACLRALLTSPWFPSLAYPRPTVRTRGSIRGQRHRTRVHSWFLRMPGISTFCDGGFTYLYGDQPVQEQNRPDFHRHQEIHRGAKTCGRGLTAAVQKT